MGPVPVVFRPTPLGYLTHYSAWPAAPWGGVAHAGRNWMIDAPPNYALKLTSAALGRGALLGPCGRARSLTLIR